MIFCIEYSMFYILYSIFHITKSSWIQLQVIVIHLVNIISSHMCAFSKSLVDRPWGIHTSLIGGIDRSLVCPLSALEV